MTVAVDTSAGRDASSRNAVVGDVLMEYPDVITVRVEGESAVAVYRIDVTAATPRAAVSHALEPCEHVRRRLEGDCRLLGYEIEVEDEAIPYTGHRVVLQERMVR